MVVSRWLAMPMAATSLAASPALAMASRTVAATVCPDFLRIVLDPAGMRIDLPQLLLGAGDRRERRVEHDGARRGRALVDGDDVGHGAMLARFGFPRKGEMGESGGRRAPSPRLRGEGRGEGATPRWPPACVPAIGPLTRIASRSDLSPQAGRGEARLLQHWQFTFQPLHVMAGLQFTAIPAACDEERRGCPRHRRAKRRRPSRTAMRGHSRRKGPALCVTALPPIHNVKQPCEIRRGLWSAPRVAGSCPPP